MEHNQEPNQCIDNNDLGEKTTTQLLQSQRNKSKTRRKSIAELSDNGITTKNSPDCVVLTQILGSSTTFFFQKDPNKQNSFLRPSAVERGIYNFDEKIKETKKTSKTLDNQIQPIQTVVSSKLPKNSINSGNLNGTNNLTSEKFLFRPSLLERGLPMVKFSISSSSPNSNDKRLSQFEEELESIIHNRRKVLEEEEEIRQATYMINLKNQSETSKSIDKLK